MTEHEPLDRSDVSFLYDHSGYMLYYKGYPIGGAGTERPARRTQGNLNFQKEQAELSIRELVEGTSGWADRIAEIDRLLKYTIPDVLGTRDYRRFTITHVLVIKGPPKYLEETEPYHLTVHEVDKLPEGFGVKPTWGDAFLTYKDDGTLGTVCRRNFFEKTEQGWLRWPDGDNMSPEEAIEDLRREEEDPVGYWDEKMAKLDCEIERGEEEYATRQKEADHV